MPNDQSLDALVGVIRQGKTQRMVAQTMAAMTVLPSPFQVTDLFKALPGRNQQYLKNSLKRLVDSGIGDYVRIPNDGSYAVFSDPPAALDLLRRACDITGLSYGNVSANASSDHDAEIYEADGAARIDARSALDHARDAAAAELGCDPRDILVLFDKKRQRRG